MMHKSAVSTFLLLSFTLVVFSSARAQWTRSGVVVSADTSSQVSPEIVTDGVGGAIIVWMDYRSLSEYDIYAQRIDGNGMALWAANGIPVCTAAADQVNPQMIPDGAGGAIIVWGDQRSGATNSDIYAQRVDANGNMLWTADGVAVSSAPANQDIPHIAPDGMGGAFISWRDDRNLADTDIYAQHIDSGGNALWAADGAAVCTSTGFQLHAYPVSDESGGAIIAWRDDRSAGDANLYAQRLDASGNPLWTVDGVSVCNAADFQDFYGPIVSDGYGGAIIVWQDRRDGIQYDIYAQRLDADGVNFWEYNGVAVCLAINNQFNPFAVSDGAGGVIIAWEDNRGPYYSDVYAQRIRVDGNAAWTVDGVPISTVEGGDYRYLYPLVSDGAGGAIIAWEDYRFMYPPKADVYSQRIDKDGNVRWQTDGALVAAWPGDQYSPQIALDNSGGAIFVWNQWGNYEDIFAQRLEINKGNWGRVEPDIASVRDVTGDQGGKVKVEWTASRLDAFDERTVTYYSIWRALDPMLSSAPPANLVRSISEMTEDFQGRTFRVEKTPGGNYYWEWIGNVNASYLPGYAFTAETLADSVASKTRWRYFQVGAHTSDPFVFWMSRPDSGYSVDNLSPAPPQGLAGDYSYALGSLTLNWKSNTEADLSHYAVYRDSGAGFVPSDQNRIATSADTTVGGLPYPPEQPYYIKLSAFDIHGNESPFAVLPPESVTTPTMVTAFESSWRDGYVEVSWDMSEDAPAGAFQVLRKAGPGGTFLELSVKVTLDGRKAAFRDEEVIPGETYTYRVLNRKDATGTLLFETSVSIRAYKLSLHQNYPNPFRSGSTIRFDLPKAMEVELSLFDVRGRKVAELASGHMAAGPHRISFGVGDFASGVYFYKLRAGTKILSRKMIIMR